jgi:hypothetical protein
MTESTAPVVDPTDASGADGANGATDRKPRAGKRRNMPKGQGAAADAQTGPAVESTPTAPTTGEPAVSTAETTPAPATPKEPRYVEDQDVVRELREGIEAARAKGFGRAKLSELLGLEGRNAIWRANVPGRVQPDEVEPLRDLLAKIESGEIAAPERKTAAGPRAKRIGRDELEHRVEVATKTLRAAVENRDLKTRTHWLTVVNDALLVLDPPQGEAK